jgi:hypothetical protein
VLALATNVGQGIKVEVLHSAPYTNAAAERSRCPLHSTPLMLAELVAVLLSPSRSRCEMGTGASHPHFPALSRTSTGSDSRIRYDVYVFALFEGEQRGGCEWRGVSHGCLELRYRVLVDDYNSAITLESQRTGGGGGKDASVIRMDGWMPSNRREIVIEC